MPTQKAGSILINLETKKIGLVYREKFKDYSFPKGHLEKGETLAECAVRETEEETMRANHLYSNNVIATLNYTTSTGEEAENHMYISIDDGETTKIIQDVDKEVLKWASIDEVESLLSYEDLKNFWKSVKNKVYKIMYE